MCIGRSVLCSGVPAIVTLRFQGRRPVDTSGCEDVVRQLAPAVRRNAGDDGSWAVIGRTHSIVMPRPRATGGPHRTDVSELRTGTATVVRTGPTSTGTPHFDGRDHVPHPDPKGRERVDGRGRSWTVARPVVGVPPDAGAESHGDRNELTPICRIFALPHQQPVCSTTSGRRNHSHGLPSVQFIYHASIGLLDRVTINVN